MRGKINNYMRQIAFICVLVFVVLSTNGYVIAATKSTLKVENATYPSILTKGSAFSVAGKISSNYKITKVSAYIFASDGTTKYTKSAKPNAKTYQVSGLASGLKFEKLAIGQYTYKLFAVDTSGANKTLVKKDFNVCFSAADWKSDCLTAFKYYKNNGFCYGVANGGYGFIAPDITNKQTNCASYVSWCLYRGGFIPDPSKGTQCAQGVAVYTYKLGWTMNTDVNNIKNGDIVYYSQKTITEKERQNAIKWIKNHEVSEASSGMHVEMCYSAKDKKFVSAGSNSSIKKGEPITRSDKSLKGQFVCSFRYPN